MLRDKYFIINIAECKALEKQDKEKIFKRHVIMGKIWELPRSDENNENKK